jgi:hypothetical protein
LESFDNQQRGGLFFMIASPHTEGPLTVEELQLATRNTGTPLEALRYDVTPVGLHYMLVHFDIPALDLLGWRLNPGGNVRRPPGPRCGCWFPVGME